MLGDPSLNVMVELFQRNCKFPFIFSPCLMHPTSFVSFQLFDGTSAQSIMPLSRCSDRAIEDKVELMTIGSGDRHRWGVPSISLDLV